jgi:hypothetical protein
MTYELIITLIMQFLTLGYYYFTSKYQTGRIDSLKNSMESQKDLLKSQADTISTFENYKKIINLTDVEKNIELKIANLRLEHEMTIANRDKEMIDFAMKVASKTFKIENGKMLRAWNELLNINAQFLMARYPTSNDAKERDEFIMKLMPFNAEYVIELMNAWTSGELDEFKKNNPDDEVLSDDNTPKGS